METNTWIYILVIAAVTYGIRALPLTLIRKEIKNTAIRSFLYYVPYVTLAVMTFPAILTATQSVLSGTLGLAAAVVLAYLRRSLFQVACGACAVVFLCELILIR